MFERGTKRIMPIVIVIAVMFTLGLVLGTLSLFYLPEDVISETRNIFDPFNESASSFAEAFRESFMSEIVWILCIWLLCSINATAPFACALITLRGFAVGFSIAFVITGGGQWVKFTASYILPQCLAAIPVMSIFAALCILNAVERKHKGKQGATYFVLGAVFIGITAVVCLGEAWATMLF